MCLRPLSFKTPAKVVHLKGGQPFMLSVKCGQCAECQTSLSQEWFFRSYYESMHTINNGGYVYFDTLTYAPEHRPTLSKLLPFKFPEHLDFPCFSRYDIRHFFVNLRSYLRQQGYDPAKRLKYFLTSEYGTSEVGQHCPHYHILFCVQDCFIPWNVLSLAVSHVWKFGRTDGLKFQNYQHVQNHVLSLHNYTLENVQKVCQYVSKYVQKRSSFVKTILQRFNDLFDYLSAQDCSVSPKICKFDLENAFLTESQLAIKFNNRSLFDLDYLHTTEFDNVDYIFLDKSNKKTFIAAFRRVIFQFHLQSKGFGESWLEFNKLEDVLRDGVISIKSTSALKPTRSIPIPLYYQRKLFYNLVKDYRDCYHWELNALGRDYKVGSISRTFDLVVQRYQDFYFNLSSILRKENLNDKENDKLISSTLDNINKLLDGRSWSDFCEYILFFKGRVAPIESRDLGVKPVLADWLCTLYDTNTSDFSMFMDDNIRGRVNSFEFFAGSLDIEDFRDYRDFVFNDTWFPEWNGFDDLFSYLSFISGEFNNFKQNTFDLIQDMRARYKQYSLKKKLLNYD